jgi:hypothetical protein
MWIVPDHTLLTDSNSALLPLHLYHQMHILITFHHPSTIRVAAAGWQAKRTGWQTIGTGVTGCVESCEGVREEVQNAWFSSLFPLSGRQTGRQFNKIRLSKSFTAFSDSPSTHPRSYNLLSRRTRPKEVRTSNLIGCTATENTRTDVIALRLLRDLNLSQATKAVREVGAYQAHSLKSSQPTIIFRGRVDSDSR